MTIAYALRHWRALTRYVKMTCVMTRISTRPREFLTQSCDRDFQDATASNEPTRK
jgi:hypothetical protein